jgi:Zn-dependent M28 family amino/carboxypeptidase
LTAQYVADQFKKLGLKPGGDSGTWFQRYPLPNRTETAPNVIGILEGSDPKLREEYLVISAHMDHSGIKRGGADSINNGASNNGSGTAGVIELAKAFSQAGAQPRRSVIFLAVSGNEKGLLGSRYFLNRLATPASQIVANFNLDGIGRNRRDTLLLLGKPLSDLGTILDRVNKAHPELHITLMNDPDLDDRFFKLSDQASFARAGIPSLCFTGYVNRDVDRVSDSPDKIDAEQETRILRLVFHFGQEIANASQRPTWTRVKPWR